jgi:hypothetical protein
MLHELDVGCADHIAAIADTFASEALDVLIHNAASRAGQRAGKK